MLCCACCAVLCCAVLRYATLRFAMLRHDMRLRLSAALIYTEPPATVESAGVMRMEHSALSSGRLSRGTNATCAAEVVRMLCGRGHRACERESTLSDERGSRSIASRATVDG